MFISEQMSLTRELDIEYMSISISIFLLYCLYQIAGIVVREKSTEELFSLVALFLGLLFSKTLEAGNCLCFRLSSYCTTF